MNFHQTKIILEKINRLMASIELDTQNISQIEKDLMLSYVKQLYETCLTGGAKAEPLTSPAPPVAKVTPTTEAPVVRQQYRAEPPAVEEAPIIERPPVVERPVVREVVEQTPIAEPAAPEPPKHQPIIIATPKIIKKSTPVVETEENPVEEELAVLFEQKEATDLAEKLGQTPIRDLTKAMSINDRILTIQELFNGDDTAFQATLITLNGLSNFVEAKEYLARNVAGKYDWASPSKEKKAKIFIKLVRRRYY